MIVHIQGNSMEPLLLNDKYYEFEETNESISNRDFVLFNFAGDKLVKRVYGTPGDIIELSDDGCRCRVSDIWFNINKKQRYLLDMFIDDYGNTIPEDCYFVLGTKEVDSRDSRMYGYIHKKDILGKLNG